MTRFTVIDPATLGPMTVVQVPDKELILDSRMARLVQLWKEYDPPMGAVYDSQSLEFDPLKINQEAATFFEVGGLNRVNQAARAVTLAFSHGADLDAVASRYPGGVPRAESEIILPTDDPVTAARKDDRYRRRIWLSPNALSPHGVDEAYVFHAMSALPTVRDATAKGIEGTAEVMVTVAMERDDPTPTQDELMTIAQYMMAEGRKGATDVLIIDGPQVLRIPYDVDLWLSPGADATNVLAGLQADLEKLARDQRWLGQDHTHHAIHGVLARPGIQEVVIKSPTKSLKVEPNQIVVVPEVRLRMAGRTQ